MARKEEGTADIRPLLISSFPCAWNWICWLQLQQWACDHRMKSVLQGQSRLGMCRTLRSQLSHGNTIPTLELHVDRVLLRGENPFIKTPSIRPSFTAKLNVLCLLHLDAASFAAPGSQLKELCVLTSRHLVLMHFFNTHARRPVSFALTAFLR